MAAQESSQGAQETSKDAPGRPKRAQEHPREPPQSQNYDQYVSKMVPTVSTSVSGALLEPTLMKNVKPSRNTIIRVRIACAPDPHGGKISTKSP